MNASRNTKIGATAALVVALAAAGGAFAASQHGGSKAAAGLSVGSYVSSSSGSTAPRFDRGHGPGDELAAAATYLGLSQSELQTQLQAGKTLGAIADATSGKSKAGLIDALVAAEKTEWAQAVKDGKLTQAQVDAMLPTLAARMTDLVNGVRPDHGPGGPGFGHGHGDGLAAAATYLGITQAQLQTQLQAGKTLGAIADATSGKSKAGLIDALVAAEKTELAQAVQDGHLTQAQADQIASGLTARVTDLVNGVMPPRGPGGPGDHDGPGFGGPPPAGGSSAQPAPSTHI